MTICSGEMPEKTSSRIEKCDKCNNIHIELNMIALLGFFYSLFMICCNTYATMMLQHCYLIYAFTFVNLQKFLVIKNSM